HKEGNIQVCAALNGIVSCGLEPLSIFCL
ncbi:transposase, partial [Escherichia coli]|nr:transposase [Escherichia coli]